MISGKSIRMKRIISNESGNCIIVPMDHGITMGPIDGIADIKHLILKLGQCPVDAMILHKGIITSCEKEIIESQIPLIMHLSAGTNFAVNQNSKVIVGSVAEAVAFGCDGVSVQINLGNEYEEAMIHDASQIAEDCYKYGMPLLAMMYARGKNIKNAGAKQTVMNLARVGAELGADIIKVNTTEKIEEISAVTQGCTVPVLIAGGEKYEDEDDFMNMVKEAMAYGIKGVSIGRNVFQSSNIKKTLEKIDQIVHVTV